MSLNFGDQCKLREKYSWIFSHGLFQNPKWRGIFNYQLMIQLSTCRLLLF